jgi:hypothetical protein
MLQLSVQSRNAVLLTASGYRVLLVRYLDSLGKGGFVHAEIVLVIVLIIIIIAELIEWHKVA